MKRIFYSVSLASLLILVSCGEEKKEEPKQEVKEPVKSTFNVVSEESSINWKGSKVGEDEAHTGKLMVASGSIETTDEAITSGVFNFDLSTLKVEDANLDSTYSAKLLGHLLSADFFAADSISNAKFVVNSVEEGVMKGDLTVFGNTQAVELNPETSMTESDIMITGTVSVDLKPFGMKYLQGPASEEETVYINPVVELTLNVKATK